MLTLCKPEQKWQTTTYKQQKHFNVATISEVEVLKLCEFLFNGIIRVFIFTHIELDIFFSSTYNSIGNAASFVGKEISLSEKKCTLFLLGKE